MIRYNNASENQKEIHRACYYYSDLQLPQTLHRKIMLEIVWNDQLE